MISFDRWLRDAKRSDGFTLVHEAAENDQVEVLRFLLSKGATPSIPNSNGVTPLLIAAATGSSNATRVLLSHGTDFTTVDDNRVNVLHQAVGHSKTLRVLVEALKEKKDFERLVSSPDSSGSTALHYAAIHGSIADISLLVKHGANLAAVNHSGATPLHLSCKRGSLPIVAHLSSVAPRLLNAIDRHGRTPLHIASLYAHTKLVSSLIENGAALLPDADGRTPFHCAAWRGSIDCLQTLLLEFPSELNYADVDKATALHLAVAAEHPEVVVFLLDNGATICDDYTGMNCLDIAIARNIPDCAEAIVNHERWEETMKSIVACTGARNKKTQLQLMVEKMPEAALIIMDKCVKTSSENSQQTKSFDFSYMTSIPSQLGEVSAMTSVRLLECMIKLKRTACLAHPLCVEFLNEKWREFGATVVIANIAIYLMFLLLLMSIIFVFPAYSPHPLEHQDSLDRLMDVIQKAKEDNRTSLSSYEKIVFCYGHPKLRVTILVATVLCLLKEFLPMWYKGVGYFTRLSNVCELTVYTLTLIFLDPLELLFRSLDIPNNPCPKLVWELAAMTTVLGWIVLFLNLQRLPHVGIYIMMVMSMVTTMLKFVVVASLFVVAFGLAFYMLMNNSAMFQTGGLSLMRVFLMSVGDLAYDDILPTFTTPYASDFNATSYYVLLRSQYGEFQLVQSLRVPHESFNASTSAMMCTASQQKDDVDSILFPSLSYMGYALFALIMPVVVLNTLIGLAVGDIAAVRADAALRKIRMQAKLLVELETALPFWFLKRVQVQSSSYKMSAKKTLRSWLHFAVKAADEPTSDETFAVASQLKEIKHNIHTIHKCLGNIEDNMTQHLQLLKSLAACVKHTQKQSLALFPRAIAVDGNERSDLVFATDERLDEETDSSLASEIEEDVA